MVSRRGLIDFDRFTQFAKLQLASGDYDAHIPFITSLCDRLKLSTEQRLWMCLLYMAYYTEGSMWAAWCRKGVPHRITPPRHDLPITTQRRNLFGGRIKKHLDGLMNLSALIEWTNVTSWGGLLDTVGGVYGNGRWASYTTSELLCAVADLPLGPDTFEILGSSGPHKGLVALGLDPVESSAQLVLDLLGGVGVEVTPSRLESILCDWAGMHKGTFYPGRNIDRQQGRILQVESLTGRRFSILWQVRSQVFPHEYLGELNGWQGMDKQRMKYYKSTGQVLCR